MNLDTVLLWVYVGAMAIGALVFVYWSTNPRGVPMYEYLIAAFIPVRSGLAYMAMALGQGQTNVEGRITYFARYLDWTVTTPLLLLALAFAGMSSIHRDRSLIAALLGADVVMILTGLIADLSPTPIRYIWYSVGVVAFLVILWLVWVPLYRKAAGQEPEVLRLYRRVAGLLTVLWIAYPAIWLLGSPGLQAFNTTITTALFVIVPIISKVGWSFVDLHGKRAFYQDRDKQPTNAAPARG